MRSPDERSKEGQKIQNDSEYAFTIGDGKQPMVLVNVGGVPNVAMIVDLGASCNAISRKLWKEFKSNKVKWCQLNLTRNCTRMELPNC